MRPAISRLARSGRLAGLTVAALLLGLLSACGGGGGGGGGAQPAPAATAAAPSSVASPQRPALASPVTASSPVVPSASPTSGGGGGSEQTYEIQSGDTLLSIAEQFYGDTTQWRKIYDANRDVIGNNPDALKLGTTIKIPPKDS